MAYFIKGPVLFYISLASEVILAFIIHKKQIAKPLEFPIKTDRIFWIFSLLFWGILFLIITNTSPFNGGHDAEYQSFASLFARGDFPIHTAWQPDYVAFIHLGASQFLGSIKIITGANYYFIQALIAFLILWSGSQILIWLVNIKSRKFWSKFIHFIPPFAGIISLGSFMITWPYTLALPVIKNNLLSWLTSLPALELPNPPQFPFLGHLDYIPLDAMILFLQRVTAMGFFIGLLPILLSPSDNKKYFLSITVLVIMIATIALTDESVLFPILPAIFLIALFSFQKRLRILIIFVFLTLTTIVIQGGVITEVLLNRYGSGSGTLIFPADRESPFEKFRIWRLTYQSSYLYPSLSNLQPFRWFRIGIVWLLSILLSISIWLTVFQKKNVDDNNKYKVKMVILIMFLSSLGALLAFHIIVPYPFQSNGWRFLFLSYKLAGIGIGFSIIYFWDKIPRKFFFLKIIITWIIIFSFTPSLLRLFPRRSDLSWFTVPPEPKKPIFEWVKKNIPLQERILALMESNPTPSANMNLATQVGAYIPIWPSGIRNYDSFDVSPAYVDLYYTLNPSSLDKLKVTYLIINNIYFSQLPESRKADIFNREFFQPVFSDPSGEVVLKVLSQYLMFGKNFVGTLEEFEKSAPKEGVFYIDKKSTEAMNIYRPLRLLFHERKVYGEIDDWNSRIGVNISFYGIKTGHYDYIVGGNNLDPVTICQCQTKLIESVLNNQLHLWKTE